MKGSFLVLLSISSLLCCFGLARLNHFETVVSSTFPVHNLNTGLDYTTIQDAINANETLNRHTIFVDVGVYNESIVVNKSISIIGENKNNTVLNATEMTFLPDTPMVNITANNVEIAELNVAGWYLRKIWAGFCSNVTIRDCRIWSSGTAIVLSGANNCTIAENMVVGGGLEGNDLIVLDGCSGCIIDNNTVLSACYDGIRLLSSNNNLICNNQIHENGYGVYLSNAHENLVFGNNISGPYSNSGVKFRASSANTVFSNILSDCYLGIEFQYAEGRNTIFHNRFEKNDDQVSGLTGSSHFNSSYEGNYWSDYNGTDANQDGIGDVSYVVSADSMDYYPLMGAFRDFTASGYDVQTISNSTISDFHFNGTAISFDVFGENGTVGFCRICIPTALIGTDYRILVNGTDVPFHLLPISNSTNSYVYFTYHHSTQEVVITSEFPSFHILSLFMIAALLAVIIHRRKPSRLRLEN
jgi:parallel beta-helix repeat protein